MNTIKYLRFAITIAALSIAVAHIIWPQLKIDAITLGLFVIALIPWLSPLFKSLEFPGGFKVEYHDLQNVKKKADEAGLLAPLEKTEQNEEYPFQRVVKDDPNLALAGLRIQIEGRLVELAEAWHIILKRQSLNKLIYELSEKGALTPPEKEVLLDMVTLLNSAVHGAKVDNEAVDWAMEVGPRLLKALDAKLIAPYKPKL